jgi:hypothetical protein
MLKSTDELRSFVAGLRIPESRRRLVEQELLDHVESRIAGGLSEAQALAALGDPDALRGLLERVEPAFEIEPLHALARGLASALAAGIVFAIIGARFQRSGPYIADIGVAAITAVIGLFVMWLVAPRGIGSAMTAEARATIAPRATTRRRAVKLYVGSMVLVFHVVFVAFITGLISENLGNDVLFPFALLGLVYGLYALYLMRAARKERSLVHG